MQDYTWIVVSGHSTATAEYFGPFETSNDARVFAETMQLGAYGKTWYVSRLQGNKV